MIFPTRLQDLLDFCEQHAPVWATNAAALGLTPAQATAFSTATTNARSAYNDRLAVVTAAKMATMDQADKVRELRRQGSDMVRLIKAKAETSPNPDSIYMIAEIPAPATPSPLPPPGTPFDFTAALNTDGSITLRWKCNNPEGASGTVYQVRRKLGSSSNFEFIGAVGTRRFVDVSLPLGTSTAQYVVTGQRAEAIGAPSSPFTVMFGVSGGTGGLTIAGQFMDNGPGETDEDTMPFKQAA